MEYEDLSIVKEVVVALNKLFEPHGFELVLVYVSRLVTVPPYLSIIKVIKCASTIEDLRSINHIVNCNFNFFTFPDEYKYKKFATQLPIDSAARDIAKNILKIEFAELMLKLGLDALRTCTSFEELLLKLEVMKS